MSVTMLSTRPACSAACRGVAAPMAPAVSSASIFSAARWYTTTRKPASSKRFAMRDPMAPKPRMAIVFISCSPCSVAGEPLC